MTDGDLRRLQRLVEELESEDAFERRDAIGELVLLTQQRLGFDWGAPGADRARAVKRWRKWLAAEGERRQGEEMQATIQALAHGKIDPAILQKLLSTLPAEQKKALLAQLVIAKAAAESTHGTGLALCERCSKRPATVRVTTLRADGTYGHVALCEACSAREAA
jgi:ATP-dependent exoDNAse (exonuclease V) beta subunit